MSNRSLAELARRRDDGLTVRLPRGERNIANPAGDFVLDPDEID